MWVVKIILCSLRNYSLAILNSWQPKFEFYMLENSLWQVWWLLQFGLDFNLITYISIIYETDEEILSNFPHSCGTEKLIHGTSKDFNEKN